MDMLKLKLSTKFMRNFIAGIISKKIFKKTGHEIGIRFDELEIDTVGDKVKIHATVDAELSKEEFIKIIKRFT